MASNFDRFKQDLDTLVERGDSLELALQAQHNSAQFDAAYAEALGSKAKLKALRDSLPSFHASYQAWYSEAMAVVKVLLPDRLTDFIKHYDKPKGRKDITFENYKIEDALQGLHITKGWEKEKVVGAEAAIPQFQQQLNILKAAQARFTSSLFDIRQLIQADLFDSELEAARELVKHGFSRAAGALAGVVLERHLGEVCTSHGVAITKKHPTIADFNDALKAAGVIDTPQWRSIQYLGDLRNLCDHDKKKEPTNAQITDLIDGVAKTSKTLF